MGDLYSEVIENAIVFHETDTTYCFLISPLLLLVGCLSPLKKARHTNELLSYIRNTWDVLGYDNSTAMLHCLSDSVCMSHPCPCSHPIVLSATAVLLNGLVHTHAVN